MARQCDTLDTRIEVLQLQLVRGPGPILHLHVVVARHQSGKAAQHHLVGAHPFAKGVLDIIDGEGEALLLLDLAAHFLNVPLPAYPSSQPRHQGQCDQQWQPGPAGMESGTIIHSTSSVPLLACYRISDSRSAERFNYSTATTDA
ncbi:hypothetical protein BAY1663_01671 [Pseudomonas sp. BAY1663]|nr:hypothetical protein BAY1663_01671 [Pseudomonas sp. BAY1663]